MKKLTLNLTLQTKNANFVEELETKGIKALILEAKANKGKHNQPLSLSDLKSLGINVSGLLETNFTIVGMRAQQSNTLQGEVNEVILDIIGVKDEQQG